MREYLFRAYGLLVDSVENLHHLFHGKPFICRDERWNHQCNRDYYDEDIDIGPGGLQLRPN